MAMVQEAETSPEQPEGFSLSEEAFKFYDHDGDLRITVEDLQSVASLQGSYGDLLGEHSHDGPFTSPTLKHMIGQVDADSSGWVSLEEFDKASKKSTSPAGTSEDQAETRKIMRALRNLSKHHLSLAEQRNLSVLGQLQLVRQKARATRRQARQTSHKAEAVAKPTWTGDHGDVHQIYTIGAPSLADPPLRNGRAANGRFEGLRIVSTDREPGTFWGYWMKSDPATWFVSIMGFEHPLIDVLVLKKYDLAEPEHKFSVSISDLHSWPGSHSPAWHFSLHKSANYREMAAAQAHWPVVQRMLDYSYQVYFDEAKLHEEARAHGSRVVEYYFIHDDSVGLIQDESTLECTLVFSGSDNLDDWVNNAQVFGSTFCGFEDVHLGFRGEMRTILSSDYWQTNFRTKLPKCGKLYTTGHSLGGALATLFAACANSADVSADDEDASLMWWKPATPELMKTKGT